MNGDKYREDDSYCFQVGVCLVVVWCGLLDKCVTSKPYRIR